MRGGLAQQRGAPHRDAGLRRIHADIQQLEGQRITSAAAIERLQYEIEKRRIRAPISGRLGEAQTLRIGAVVREGDKLGAVVPSGTLRIIADFLPPAALGRIRPGQPVRMRLEGFPWAQYGSVSGTVSSVASEIRDGRVRVECSVSANPSTPIPLQHGLPGSVEVQVEQISPAALALRAAGQMVSAPKTAFGAPSPVPVESPR
jgi:multidrug resistance efflux pump